MNTRKQRLRMFGSVNFLWRYAGLFGSKLNDLVVQEAKPQFVGDYSADILIATGQ